MKFHGKRKQVAVGLLAAVLVLGSASVLYAASGEGSLSPAKLKDLGWRVMNFVALMIILVKFLKKPMANALAERQQGIADEFESLNERKSEVEQNYQQCEAKLAKIDDEVERIIENAKAQAETEKERIIAEAERAAEDIKRKADLAVQFEISESRQRLRDEIAEQAAVMAEELIKQNLQESDQNAIVEDYLNKVGAMQ